ncbi:MAG TPA: hypothetical protein VK853_09630 [Ilumatobacteraceae bacterium]|nr:hypothetical protein [Ilumatobacteraceae bacterium]
MTNADPTSDLRLSGAVDPVEEERVRLETEIAVAKARLLAAQHAAAQRDAESKQALRQELSASRDQLAELERTHESAVREVREAASSEVERLLAAAHRQAAEIESGIDCGIGTRTVSGIDTGIALDGAAAGSGGDGS